MELFEYLSSLADKHQKAWDCAAGNGQAAHGLVPYFDEIIATDASESQIQHAKPHKKIIYKTATAEDSGIDSASVDLITVATAIHWLNTDLFYPEVKRILKKNGIIAVWTYSESNINREIDLVSGAYSGDVIGIHWPEENKKAWNFEEMTDFPFERIYGPEFKIEVEWNMKDFMNYLYTWSATQNYIKATGKNPLEIIYGDLLNAWGDESKKRPVTWKLNMKAGRV